MRSVNPREGRSWPAYMLGGRLRTTTVALVIAFCAIWWLYETYEPGPPPPEQVPASEVVPPGFIPDPAYTWAPRTNVQEPEPTTTSTTPTTSTAPTSATPTTPVAPTTSVTPTEPGVPPPAPPETPAPGQPTPSAPEPGTPAAMAPAPAGEPAPAPAAPAR
ncbi:hypothetical protein [Mycolicibacterium sp.]|uniref:hypothetical protein n=1 Tax=Mycolicibacterium sp. TaxID=2320850 RepID=UPI0028AA3B4B|nr:hypothetical protein [Mycolicibacterium sp.]